MLAQAGPTTDDQLRGELPLQVELPDSLASFFDESGFAATTANEQRRCARLRHRCEVAIQFTRGIPTLPRPCRLATGLVKDLSRSGIGILYHEQLYPGEQIDLTFRDHTLSGEVIRCRKLGARCFEIGLLRIEPDDASACD